MFHSLFTFNYFVLLGLLCKHVNTQDELTILIDFAKYQEIHHSKLAITSNKTSAELCSDSKNEEYQKCGNKCILSCRFGTSLSEIVSSRDCDKTECFEGCYCKDGFVRYQNKCILVGECPTRANKAIEDATDTLGTLEKRRPCFGSGCSSNPDCNDEDCSPKPSSSPCNSPGCISIVNHNQAIISSSINEFQKYIL